MNSSHKYMAHFVIEADTPFAVGSGEKGYTVDRLITRDALGLPYIPGTSLSGVLRHELDPTDDSAEVKKLFGYQEKKAGQGSRIVCSSAHLVGDDGTTVMEGLKSIDFSSGYYGYFQKLPTRDHVRINDKGTADVKSHGKFDEELVHKGTRFAFNIELSGDQSDQEAWQHLIDMIHQPFFRIGAGTRKGFGKLKIISCKTKIYDLHKQEDLLAYLEHDNTLNEKMAQWQKIIPTVHRSHDWIQYELSLIPESFFLFGAGYGDEDVDNKPKTERYFDWESGKPVLAEKDWLLIPSTSIKGALSHRVAYHYNQLIGIFIGTTDQTSMPPPAADNDAVFASFSAICDPDNLNLPSNSPEWDHLRQKVESMTLDETLNNSKEWKQFEDKLDKYQSSFQTAGNSAGENNPAVKLLFGYALDSDESGARGNVILSDIYLEPVRSSEKVFSHVAIDRFTGGARDGMLFQQKATTTEDLILNIYVKRDALLDEIVKEAFEKTLGDLCRGNLQLGGGSGKGHGVFKGSYKTINT